MRSSQFLPKPRGSPCMIMARATNDKHDKPPMPARCWNSTTIATHYPCSMFWVQPFLTCIFTNTIPCQQHTQEWKWRKIIDALPGAWRCWNSIVLGLVMSEVSWFWSVFYSTSVPCMLLTHPLISIGYCRDPLCFVNGNGPAPIGDRDVVVLCLETWPDLPWQTVESKPVRLLQHLLDLWFWSSNMAPFPKPTPFLPAIAVGAGWLILWQKGQHSQQVEFMWEEWMSWSGKAEEAAMAITNSESHKASKSVTCTPYSAVLMECWCCQML